jgi:hypothetical protein
MAHWGLLLQKQTNQNFIHEQMRRRLKVETAYYHSVQGVCRDFAYKNIKINIYTAIIFPCNFFTLKFSLMWETTLKKLQTRINYEQITF